MIINIPLVSQLEKFDSVPVGYLLVVMLEKVFENVTGIEKNKVGLQFQLKNRIPIFILGELA